MTTTATYSIVGGDYDGAGSASKQLKGILKRIGVEPKTLRKVMIAAYETEMNTVIHAQRGLMKVAVDPTQVDVAVEDEGPGIPDVEAAMQEGFSTAPARARKLGFGAGMGLPNVQKNTDQFSIRSTVGLGTQVRFRIFLQPQASSAPAPNAVHVAPGLCRQCLRCLHACPTQAMRVRVDRPQVLAHLCVDCASCIEVCEAGALTMDVTDALPDSSEASVLVIPVSLLEQFGPDVDPAAVLEALHDAGFRNVQHSGAWETALRTAVEAYARVETGVRPVISPMCPAVLNLIQVRYPSLLGHVAPFLTPIEAAHEQLTVPHAVFVPVCPSQHTILRSPSLLSKIDVASASAMRRAVLERMGEPGGRHYDAAIREVPRNRGDVLHASGMRRVVKVLDEIENGLKADCGVIELFACSQGCFGAPVWDEDPLVARRRYERSLTWYRAQGKQYDGTAKAGAVRRIRPLEPRAGLRLDPDMRTAIEKLARIDTLTRTLPGRNCGVCGAPTCAALAEDIVLGRASISACVYLDHIPTEEAT